MRLGDLIDTLAELPPDAPIQWDDGRPVGRLHSYRGFYRQLALGGDGRSPTVADVLTDAREAVDKTFEGYKGGDFVMNRHTPIWAADYGDTTDYGIAGAAVIDGAVVLLKLDVSDYRGW